MIKNSQLTKENDKKKNPPHLMNKKKDEVSKYKKKLEN